MLIKPVILLCYFFVPFRFRRASSSSVIDHHSLEDFFPLLTGRYHQRCTVMRNAAGFRWRQGTSPRLLPIVEPQNYLINALRYYLLMR